MTSKREYPARIRADIQASLNEALAPHTLKLFGVRSSYRYESLTLADLMEGDQRRKLLTPVQYSDDEARDAVEAFIRGDEPG